MGIMESADPVAAALYRTALSNPAPILMKRNGGIGYPPENNERGAENHPPILIALADNIRQ
jgi:hypothetical protein